jgi:DNA-binding CsgD family transcriptional regulator
MGTGSWRPWRHPEEVIEALYEAALQPEQLPDALHDFARLFNATVGLVIGIADHRGRLIISPDGKEGAAAYATEWWKHDFITQRGEARQLRGVVTDFHVASEEEISSHPFFQEFARPYDIYWLAANVVRPPGGAPFSISIRRAERFGPFDQDELFHFERMCRHAVRAVNIAIRIGHATSRERSLAEGLTKLGYGVIGLSAAGRVVSVNPVAESLCTTGLRICNGGLFAATSAGQQALNALMAGTLALSDRTADSLPPAIALPRTDGRTPLVVLGIPVPVQRGDIGELLGSRVKALLIVVETDAKRTAPEALLRQMFDLTAAEARAAALVATGARVADAARLLRVTEGTLRIQLKQSFKKMGVSRQVELALLLAPLLHPQGIHGATADGT